MILVENVAFRPNNKNSSDFDAARRRRHGQSCLTFQFVFFRKLSRKNKMDKLSRTDHTTKGEHSVSFASPTWYPRIRPFVA